MRSAIPKPLHAIAGRSLLGHAIAAARELEPDRLAVVVRHGRDQVASHALELEPAAVIVDQDHIPGTGRAVQCALDALDALARDAAAAARPDLPPFRDPSATSGEVVVIPADAPLIDGATLAELLEAHRADANAVTILTAEVADPTGYGRVARAAGQVTGIVEERDATPAQRAIREVNSSMYVFDSGVLRDALARLGRDNAQGEVYLTDVVKLARADGGAARAIMAADAWVIEGVNDRVQLARLGAEFNRRTVEEAMAAGVTVVDPATTRIDVGVELAEDVVILPGTHLGAGCAVAAGAVIGPWTTLTGTRVGQGATLDRTVAVDAVVGPGAAVGPFTYLRPGTVLGADAKAGGFVEMKNAQLGAGAKVPHLSYVGDATVGEGTNVGAATIVANYDGVAKHQTRIGAHARIGSDSILVAPIVIGDGAYTGAGSVIRRDVPAGALAVSGTRQRVLPEWTVRRRPGTPAAAAALEALEAQAAQEAQEAQEAQDAQAAQAAQTGEPAGIAELADDDVTRLGSGAAPPAAAPPQP